MTTAGAPQLDATTRAILESLPFEWLVVRTDFRVLGMSAGILESRLIDGLQLVDATVRRHVVQAVRTAEVAEIDLELKPTLPSAASRYLRIRACPLDDATCALLVEDVSNALRLDAMRRDFIVNVSHELKTPVGALLLLAEAVRESGDDVESQRRFVDRIKTEAERLSRLVNDLSDLSRIQSAELPERGNAVPAQRIVAEAIDTVKLLAQQRDIEIVAGSFKGLRVEGSESQLLTALRNLLTNALAYSPEGTKVSVSGRQVDGLVEISVTDQGIGISEQDLDRIFERFYRIDPARSRNTGGTGLGLAIVKHICAAHGGECVVWSQPGEGSTFTLRLPAAR